MTSEHYLAGAILIDPQVLHRIEGLVRAGDFEDGNCRTIYSVAKAITAEGGAVDPVSVRARAARYGLELPVKYLAELMQIVPTAANCEDYARRVAEDSRLRQIKALMEQIQADGTSTPDELLQRIAQGTERLARDAPAAAAPFFSLFKPLTDFSEEDATWLIPGWIPESQITLIAADGGVGKTTLWCDIIAALSSGRRCILDPPEHTRQPMKIAFCTTEDSVRKKLRRKLREAGANMGNIITMDLSADKDGALRAFKFGSGKMDLFIRHFKPAVCVFDPVQGFLPPKVNMGSRNEMRDCMAPLTALGEDMGTTFLVICHTNKRKGAYGRDRIADSADLWDIARSVIMAGYTESQGVRYISNEKNNYAQLQETILFSINEAGQIIREGTSWKRDREYMQEAVAAKAIPTREDCKEFILSMLRDAPTQSMKADDLVKKAAECGHSFRTVRRSREELNNEGLTENHYIGTGKRGGRLCFVRLKAESGDAFDQLSLEIPTPFGSENDDLLPV